MRVELRLRSAILLLVVVLITASAASAVGAHVFAPEPPTYEEEIVTLDDGAELWPYTSRAPAFEERTLAINLVIYGDVRLTEFMLRDDPARDWEEVDEDREDIAPAEDADREFNETITGFGTAAGAERWVWVNPPNGDPVWLQEAYQLEDGDYLGERQHIRAYADPEANSWTALQAHSEHWDWFHLRHTVHSIEEAQLIVEETFVDRAITESLQRERFGNSLSSDSDGWVTVVHIDDEFLPIALGLLVVAVGGMATATRPRELGARMWATPGVELAVRALAAALSIVIAYHAVRFGAIGVERFFDGANPKLIVAVFYPALVVGMPIVAYLTSRQLGATEAFAAATVGFAVAVLIDYTYLDVVRIPLETFVHRGALAVALGMIAAGATATARDPRNIRGYVRTGVLLWLVAILIPLMQFV